MIFVCPLKAVTLIAIFHDSPTVTIMVNVALICITKLLPEIAQGHYENAIANYVKHFQVPTKGRNLQIIATHPLIPLHERKLHYLIARLLAIFIIVA